MKSMKPFVKTCYSEWLLAEGESAAVSEATGANASGGEVNGEAVKKVEGYAVDAVDGEGDGEVPYLGGLGLKFKFPGDAKKRVSNYL